MDPGQLPTFDPCCEFGFSTQLSETVYLGLEGAKVASRGGGWVEPFLPRLPEAHGPSRLAAEESALHDPSRLAFPGAAAGAGRASHSQIQR